MNCVPYHGHFTYPLEQFNSSLSLSKPTGWALVDYTIIILSIIGALCKQELFWHNRLIIRRRLLCIACLRNYVYVIYIAHAHVHMKDSVFIN